MTTEQRRLALRVTLKLLTLAALMTVAFVLLDSVTEEAPASRARPALEVDLATVAPGELRRIPWGGGNLLLLHRPEVTMRALEETHAPGAIGPYLLLYDRGGDLGCPLEWYPPDSAGAPFRPWHGGLREQCQGVWYDAAGRPLQGQQSERELTAPPYILKGEGLLSVGGSGDNAAPQR